MKLILQLLLIIGLPISLYSQNLVSVTPNTGYAGQTLNVTITGNNTQFDQGTSTMVNFGFNQGSGTTVINSMSIVNATTITANISIPSTAFTGDYDVSTHSENDGFLYLPNYFHVDGVAPPTLVSISPNSGNAGQNLTVTITGNGTHFTQGSATELNFGFIQGSPSTVINSMTIVSDEIIYANITIPDYVSGGYYDVLVINDIDGYLPLHDAFYVEGLSFMAGYVIPYSVSSSGSCDGSATAVVYGGSPPYTYLYSNGSNSEIGLNFCEGLQSLFVTDFDGNTMQIDFIVPSPSNLTVTDNYSDSTAIGTLYPSAIINCDIDYDNIDSAYISYFTNVGGDSIEVVWNVVSSGNTTVIPVTYAIGMNSGVYEIVLEVYCPFKAVGDFLTAYDKILYEPIVGINETEEEQEFTIYPNPFNEIIAIELDKDQLSEVFITDLTGKLVYSNRFNQKKIQIDLSNLSTGQYIVQMKNNESISSRKIIKH